MAGRRHRAGRKHNKKNHRVAMESGGTMQQEGTNGFHVGAPPNVMDAPTGVDLKADSPGKDALSQRMGAENIKSTDAETRHSGIDGHAVAPDDVPVSEWNDAIPQGMDQSFSEDEMSHSRDMITNRCASEEPHEANPDSPARLDPQSMEEKPTSSDASRNTSRALTSHLVYETPGTLEAEGEDEFLAGEGRRIPGLGNPCIPVEIVPPFSASSDTGSGGSVAPGDMVHTDKGGHALGDRPRRSPGTHVPGGMVYGDVGGVSSLALKPEGGPTEEDDDPASGTGNRRQPEADRGGWCLGTGPEKPSGWDPEAHAPEASGEMLDVDGAGGTTSSATTPDTLRDLTNSWAGFSKAEENASGRRTGNAAMGPLCGNGARGDGGDTAVLVSPRGIVTNAGRTPSPPEVRGVSKEATPRFSPQTVRKMGEHSSSQPAGGGVGDLVVERHLGGVAPSLQAVKATLARNMAKATVGQMLSNPRRETVEDLARRGIIVTPESGMARSLQGTAMKLERMMTRDNLKHQLEIRSCAEDIHLGSGEIGLTQTRIRSGGSSSSGSARGSGRIAIAPSLQARSVELDLNMRKAAVNRMLRRRPSLCEMDLRGWFDPNAPVLTPSPTHAYEVAYAMVAANRAQTAPTSEASVSSAEDARSTTTGDHSPRSCPVSPFLDPTEPSYVFSLIHCPGELMGADSGDEAVAVSARETDVSFEEEGVWMSKGSRYTRSLMGACSSADVTVISTTSKSVTNTSTSTTSDGIFDSPVGSDQDASTSLARPLHEDVADAEYPDKGSEGDLCCLERPQPEKSGVHGSASSVPVVFGQSTDGDAEAIGDVAREQVRTDVSSDVGDLYGRELCGELSVGLPPATSRGTGASTHAVGDSRSSAEVVIFGGEDKGVDRTLASGRRAEERGASTKGGESRTCREGSNERTSSAVLGGDDRGFSRATALAGRSSPLPALCPIPTAAFDDTPKLSTEIVCERGKEPREMDLGHGGDAIEEERIGDEEYVPAPEDEGVHSPVDLRCATRGGLDWDGDGDGDGGADGDGDGALSPFVEVEGTRDAFRDSPQDRELVCRRPSQVNGSDGGEGTISWDRNDATPVAGEERSSLEVRDLNGGPCDRSAEGSMEEYLRHAALQNDGEATVPSVRNASETISTGEDSSVGVTDRSKMPSTDGSRSDGGDPSTDDPLDSPGESPALKFVSHRADESPNGLCQGGPGGGSSRRSPDICANHSRDYASSMENARRVDDFHPSPLCSQTQRQDYPSVSPDPYATFGLDISFLTPDAVSPAASNLASAETPPTGSRIMREVAQVGRRAARVVGINGQGQSAAEAEDAREKRRQETLQRVAESETPPVSRRTLSVSGGSGERRHLEAFFTSRGDPTDSGEGTGDICLDQGNFHRRISSAMRQPSPRVGDICLEGEGDAEEQVLLSWSFEGPLAPEQKVDAASPSVGAGAEDYPPASPAISIVPKSGCGEDEVVEEVGMHREATDEAVVEEVGMHWEATDEAVVEEVGTHWEATDEAVVEEATGSAEEAAGPAWRRSKEVFRSPGRPGGGGEDIRDVEPKVEVFGEMDEPRNPRTEEWKLAAGSQAAGGSCDLGDGGVLPVRSGSTPGSPLPSRSDDCTGRSGDGDGHGDGDEETDGDQDEAGVDGLQQVEPLASPPEVAMSLSLSPVLSPIVMRSASKEGGWSHDADRERQRSENGSPVGEPSPSPGARDAAVACGADDGAGAETDAAVDEKGSAIVAGEESGAVYANSGGNHVGRDDGRDDDRDDGRDDESSSYQECAERNPWEADRGKQEESCPSSPRSMEMSPWNTDVSKSAASTALASALIMINSVGSSSHCKAADDDSNRVGDREVQQGCPGESVAGQGTPAVVGARMPADSLGPGDDKASEAIGGVVDDIPGGRDQEPDWRSRERPCESGETPKSPSPSSSSDERKSMVAGGSSGRWSPRESGSGDERSSVERNGGAMRRKDAPDTEAAGLDTDMRMLEGSHRMFTAIVEGCFGGGDGGVEKEGCKAVDEARLCRGGGGGSTAETNGSKGTMRSSFGREDFFMGLQACLYLSTTKALDDLGRARLKGLILSEDDRVLGALAKLRDGGDLEQLLASFAELAAPAGSAHAGGARTGIGDPGLPDQGAMV